MNEVWVLIRNGYAHSVWRTQQAARNCLERMKNQGDPGIFSVEGPHTVGLGMRWRRGNGLVQK